jgi:hypothetical protein
MAKVHFSKEKYYNIIHKYLWEFHKGGYQVCIKWLKDRKGRQLTNSLSAGSIGTIGYHEANE